MLELISSPGQTLSSNAALQGNIWVLRLYVAGKTSRSVVALTNLRRICEQYVPDRYAIEVIDLLETPQLAKIDQILAIPTLVRDLPKPIRKIIGDLSNTERVLAGLDIFPGAGVDGLNE